MKQFFSGLAILFAFSCHNNNPDHTEVMRLANEPTIDSSELNTPFFPVTSFIKGQMLQFDSIPVTALHITITNGKEDSEWLKREQLKPFLQAFVKPEINETNLTKYFKESRFNDQTINAVTLTYDPISILPDSINLSSWNVYINPISGKVTKIYIVKNIKENNQSITQQLTWESDRMAEITNIINNKDGSSKILKQEKFIWDFTSTDAGQQ